MGRNPCDPKKLHMNRGVWTEEEDRILKAYVQRHGTGKWNAISKKSGLKRCGKSCRLRWLNYLRPGIKRGNITGDEEDLIMRLHKLLGNRWSLIAARLPGRTDNEIKNYWNTCLKKKVDAGLRPDLYEELPVRTKAVRLTEMFAAAAVGDAAVAAPDATVESSSSDVSSSVAAAAAAERVVPEQCDLLSENYSTFDQGLDANIVPTCHDDWERELEEFFGDPALLPFLGLEENWLGDF